MNPRIRYPFGRPPAGIDVLWRLEAQRYSVCVDAERGLYSTSAAELQLFWYPVQKRTPCGAWANSRFIRLTALKRYACNTEEEAIESFRTRKTRQISILSHRLREAEEELQLLTLAPHALIGGET